jgi:hypothetical protein
MSCYLAEAKYGKDKVRVFRVVKDGETHHVVEYNVQVLVEGEMETRRATVSFLYISRMFLREKTVTQRGTTASSSRQIL